MSRPIVVIPACTKIIDGHAFDAVGRKYSAAVAEVAECQPLLVPVGAGMTDIGAVLELADAILLSGSRSNVAPEHYGEETPINPDALDPLRDAVTLAAHPRSGRAQDAAVRHLPRLSGAERRTRRQPASGGARRERPQGPSRQNKCRHRRGLWPGPQGVASREIARLGRKRPDHGQLAALAGHRAPRRAD